MNTIKWNSTKTGFVLTFSNGVKETYGDKVKSSTTYIRIGEQKYWLIKVN
jgi:hypothetical protein